MGETILACIAFGIGEFIAGVLIAVLDVYFEEHPVAKWLLLVGVLFVVCIIF